MGEGFDKGVPPNPRKVFSVPWPSRSDCYGVGWHGRSMALWSVRWVIHVTSPALPRGNGNFWSRARTGLAVSGGLRADSLAMNSLNFRAIPRTPDICQGNEMVETVAIDDLSFEHALAELERIVGQLESGQAPLEDSIALYERGALLKAHCEKRLEAARLRVEKIVVGAGGSPGVEPAEFS